MVIGAPFVRFYAGAPVHEANGQPIGTLCLMDPTPRAFNSEQTKSLRDFADLIEHELNGLGAFDVQNRLADTADRMSQVLKTMPDMVFVIDKHHRFLASNDHPDLLIPRSKLIGNTIDAVMLNELGEQLSANIGKALHAQNVIYHNYTFEQSGQSFEARYKKIDHDEVLVIVRNVTEYVRLEAQNRRLSEVARQTTNGVVITDVNGLVVWINEGFTRITEYTLDDILGKKPGELLQGADTDAATVQVIREALTKHESFLVDLINYTKTGRPYWIRITCNPLKNSNDEIEGFIAIEADVTKEKQDAEVIRHGESLLQTVIDANSIGTWRFNIQTGELQINDKWAALLGYELNDLMPTDRKTWEELTHPDDLAYCLTQLDLHAHDRLPVYEANMRMKHKNGEWVWINTRGRVTTRTPDGKAEWLLGTHFDVNAQIQAESTLSVQSKQMQAIVENMLDGVISIDRQGNILTFNRAAEQIFGYASDEVLGRNVSLLMQSPHREQHDNYISNYIEQGIGNIIGRNRELEALRKDGTQFTIEIGLVELQLQEEITFIGIVRDITERKQREQEIHKLAFYDPLTELPNRRLLLDRLLNVISTCTRQNEYAALLFLDLDNFKNLNDSAGHSIGDQLLYQVAKRMVETVRQGDTVSRIGGDEFVVVLEGLGQDKKVAAQKAETIAQKIVIALSKSFDLEGKTFNGTASIGITLFNGRHVSNEDLLKQADMAMYKAKAAGRNSVCFYDPEMQVAVIERAALEQDLINALDQQQFQLYFQKQVNQFGELTGAEALIRWIHPVRGIVSPADFIPLAEETGLIVPIGQWVIFEACRTLVAWASDPRYSNASIAVNISVAQFRKADFVAVVLEAINATSADPHKVKLEITESLLASNVPDIKTKMHELRQHGIGFAIDDFGTGYSSLSYLKQLPINQLKIDQSFVRDLMNNQNDQAITQTIITLAEAMNLEVIAEGVETPDQRNLLLSMGCPAFQGFLFGRPCPIDQFAP